MCTSLNEIKVIKQTSLLRHQELLSSPTPPPLLFLSCQCQRAGSVNGQMAAQHSPLSLPSFPLFPSPPPATPLFEPPLHRFFHHISLLRRYSDSQSLSHCCRRGYTPLSCPELCCQASPRFSFPSLMAVHLLCRLPEKWKQPQAYQHIPPPAILIWLFIIIPFLLLISFHIQSETDAFNFFEEIRRATTGSQNQETLVLCMEIVMVCLWHACHKHTGVCNYFDLRAILNWTSETKWGTAYRKCVRTFNTLSHPSSTHGKHITQICKNILSC